VLASLSRLTRSTLASVWRSGTALRFNSFRPPIIFPSYCIRPLAKHQPSVGYGRALYWLEFGCQWSRLDEVLPASKHHKLAILLMSNQSLLECFCGRTFSHQNAYGNHQRSCQRTKKRVSGVLGQAKEFFTAKKKRKVSQTASALATIAATPLALSSTEAEVCAISVFD